MELNDGTPCNFEIAYQALASGEENVVKKDHYTYLVIKKGEKTKESSWPRIVRPTLVRSKHSICRMCTSDGKLEEIIFTASKQGKFAYRCAKATKWGDQLPMLLSEKDEVQVDESTPEKE